MPSSPKQSLDTINTDSTVKRFEKLISSTYIQRQAVVLMTNGQCLL